MNDQAIKNQKEYLKNNTDDQLLKILHDRLRDTVACAAAKQLLEERRLSREQKNHLAEESTNKLTRWILALTILILIIATIQLMFTL